MKTEACHKGTKKRVCIIHKVTTSDPRSFYKQGLSLFKAGFEIILLGLYGKNQTVHGIRLYGFPQPKNRMTRFLLTNFRIFVVALRLRADVYHFHDFDFIPWALFLKTLTRAKVIYDIHESYPDYMLLKAYIPQCLRKILSFLTHWLEHISIKFFDAIVPNDNFIGARFHHRNNVVIFNFPTLDFFNGKKSVPYHKRRYDLFYHGSLPKYHFETMLKIAQKLNASYVKNRWGVVMDRCSPLDWAKQQVEKKQLEGNFEFLPYVDYLEVAKYLNIAKIGIIPLPPLKKFTKNIPLKMFEFMGMGLPIVLSDLPPSRQFINGQNCAVTVEPDNIDQYVDAIKSLLKNPKKSRQMGQVGERLVLHHYNWSEEERKVLNLYRHLTS